MTRKSSNQPSEIPLPSPLQPGHMRFGLTAWKETPLAVKLGYLEAQKALAEAEGINQQLREQRDRLRNVSRQYVRYGLSRWEANLAYTSREERRLVARCARLKRAHRIERRDAKAWRKTAQTLTKDKQRMLRISFKLLQEVGETQDLVREMDLCLARKLTAEQTADLRQRVKALPWLQEKDQ